MSIFKKKYIKKKALYLNYILISYNYIKICLQIH